MDGPTGPGSPEDRNIVWSHSSVTDDERRRLLGHGPATVWFTGLSGSGKSTVALAVERALVDAGQVPFVLDGDNVRHGLCADLGFGPEDRTENIRRVGEVCGLFHQAGMIVLTAFVSPYRVDRARVRELHPAGGFLEVFVDTPLEVCESRDVKGLYAKARAGDIPDFTGISAPYESPNEPELRLLTEGRSVDDCAAEVVDLLSRTGVLP